jgi:hypothetical protein
MSPYATSAAVCVCLAVLCLVAGAGLLGVLAAVWCLGWALASWWSA